MREFYDYILTRDVLSKIIRRFLISTSLGNLFFKLKTFGTSIPYYDVLTLFLILILGLVNVKPMALKKLIHYLLIYLTIFMILFFKLGLNSATYAFFIVLLLLTITNIFTLGLQSRVDEIQINNNYQYRDQVVKGIEILSTILAFVGYYLSYLDKF